LKNTSKGKKYGKTNLNDIMEEKVCRAALYSESLGNVYGFLGIETPLTIKAKLTSRSKKKITVFVYGNWFGIKDDLKIYQVDQPEVLKDGIILSDLNATPYGSTSYIDEVAALMDEVNY
jgi:hypothetical protein